jgi:hypothetical protein
MQFLAIIGKKYLMIISKFSIVFDFRYLLSVEILQITLALYKPKEQKSSRERQKAAKK